MKQPVCSGMWISHKNHCDCLYCQNNARAWRRWINAQENVARLTVQGAPEARIMAAKVQREMESHRLLLAGRGIIDDHRPS